MKKKPMKTRIYISLLLFVMTLASCAQIDVFEKNVAIKDHAWKSDDKITVQFDLKDTLSYYNIYLVIRHTDAYNYNNIWLNLFTQAPGDTVRKVQLPVQLADNKKGWLGTGMDDIFEHRVRINASPLQFKKAGTYRFTLQQIMREDPLQHILNAGIRVERKL
jgi:gliding motility-associated lipoprotein GldH